MALALQPALAQAPRVATAEELRAAFATEVVLIGVLDSSLWVERYRPDGWVSGTQHGRRSSRRWRIEGDRVCRAPDGPGRICATLQVSSGGALDDHAPLGLGLDNGFGTVAQAVFRVAALARPSPPGVLRGQVIELWRDAMLVRPDSGPHDVWVRSAPVPGLHPADRVVLWGRSDGLVFGATRGRRMVGSRGTPGGAGRTAIPARTVQSDPGDAPCRIVL